MDKVTIPAHIVRTPCLYILSDRIIRSTKRKHYKACDEHQALIDSVCPDRRGRNIASLENLAKRGEGRMSYHTRLAIRRVGAIFRMGRAKSQGTIKRENKGKYLRGCFITLTIAGMEEVVDSKKGYEKLIKKMMQWLVYRYDIRDYIWRFEWQERGQGHWHILCDKWVVSEEARAQWWGYLQQLGLTKEFNAKYDFVPESACKIKGIRCDSDLDRYLWEYFWKQDQSVKPTEGRWWGASDTLRKSCLPVLPVDNGFDERMQKESDEGRADVFDVEVDSVKSNLKALPGISGQPDKIRVCTIVKPKKVKIEALLLKFQQDILNQYILCYRQGNWERAREMANAFGNPERHHQEWINHFMEVNRDLAQLKRVEKSDYSQKVTLTKRQRLNVKRRQQSELLLRQQAGVSLFT